MNVYAMLDKKATMYGMLLMAPNDAMMCRTLEEQIGGSKNTVASYPEDFELYFFGTFDEVRGKLVPEDHPQYVASMVTVLNKSPYAANLVEKPSPDKE